jgi:site-specific DNA-methyltransferase (adenine-specific)
LRSFEGNSSYDFDAVARQIYRVLTPGGVCCWVERDQVIDGQLSGAVAEHWLRFRSLGFWLHDQIVMLRAGTKFSQSRRVEPLEYCLVVSKGRPATARVPRDKPNKHAGRTASASWRLPEGGWREKRRHPVQPYGYRPGAWRYAPTGPRVTHCDHPAVMPKQMAADLIWCYSNPGDVVLDVFAGSGTTGVEALKLQRRFFGIEICREYFLIAQKNFGSSAEFVGEFPREDGLRE